MEDILDRLAYLKQVAFFRVDALKKMQEIGIPPETAYYMVYTDSFRNADLIQWWIDYGDALGEEMLKYLETF